MNTLHTAIKFLRSEFPSLRFTDFCNLWQIANEITILNVTSTAFSQLEQQGHKDFLKIIKLIQSAQIPAPPAHASMVGNQLQFSSLFLLEKQALEYHKLGLVLVCDNFSLWQQLNLATSSNPINMAADWICKVYTYATKKTLISSLEILRHPLLAKDKTFNEAVINWEYLLRKNQQLSTNLDYPDHPLCHHLQNITNIDNFVNYFKEIFNKLPITIKEGIVPLIDEIEILNGTTHCLEWFRGAVSLKTCSHQVRLGILEALRFKPSNVVFCLKSNQIGPLQSHLLLKNFQGKNLTELFYQWADQTQLNVFGYTQEEIFAHPLVQSDILEKPQVKRVTMIGERPIANPIVSSRPTTISATGFNQLMQDPYGFYANYILKLKPLERTSVKNSAKELGLAIHKMIEVYLKEGKEAALKYMNTLTLSNHSVLWRAKLSRILDWVQNQMNALNPTKVESEKELSATLTTDGSITLKARIDACIFTSQGNLVVNFKTGIPPSKADVTNGYSPQLAIEMFLVAAANNTTTQAEFWQLKGTQPAGIVSSNIAFPTETLRNELEKIAMHYLIKHSSFLTCPWPSKTPKWNEYKNLERLI